MNMFKKTALCAAILVGIVGCTDEDYKGPQNTKTENTTPTHGGDIVINVNEVQYDDDNNPSFNGSPHFFLMGTPTGEATGDGMAIDADGDFLSVKNVTYKVTDSSDPDFDETNNFGLELADGNTMLVVSLEKLRLQLDSGQTRTIEYNYEITDGVESLPRKLTVTVTGEDFEPVAEEDINVTYSKASTAESIDLLEGIADFDGELLNVKAGSLQQVSTNDFELPVTLEGNTLKVDVASIKDQIPNEQYVAFNYTYVVMDHNHEVSRDLTIGLLGVEPQPGEPFFANYFLEENLTENSNATTVDLTVDVFDDDGEVSVKDVKFNGGAEMPKGIMLDGNMVTIVPATYSSDLQVGDEEEIVIDFKIEDESGNEAQGRRTLTVKIKGENNNLLVANGFNADFEDVAKVGDVAPNGNTNGFTFPWPHNDQNGCPVNRIQGESARTGDFGFRMEGNYCANVIDGTKFIKNLATDDKYLVSYWLRSEEIEAGGNGNPYVVVYGNYWTGSRFTDETLNVWNEVTSTVDGSSDAFTPYVGQALAFNMGKYAGNGKHDLDDFTLIRYSAFTHSSLDLLVNDYGTFENSEAIDNDAGSAEIADGKLKVNTTGAASGVTLTMPLEAGMVKANQYYVVTFDIENTTSDDDSTYTVKLTNGTESIIWSGAVPDGSAELIINEEIARTANVDWSAESMSLELTLSNADTEYNLDNVRVYAVPKM
ncbi:hypothetical protein [Catenovulum sediminis]|uniref:Uncharacterized protein n=1 Tax=Catenovulum sediminis TaxID=1740262 RepID=A0ABV1RJ47_9ALTE